MLYQRWLAISRRYANRPAIFDDGRVIHFGELALAAEAAPECKGTLVVRSGGAAFFVGLLRAWRDRRAAIPVERDAPEPVLQREPPAEIRLVKHTPGARGIPRGIFFTGEQVAADVDRLVAAMRLSPELPNLAAISLAHSYGLSSVALPLLLHGIPVHLAAVPFPRPVEEILRNHGPMVVPAVPSIWRAWQRAGILRKDLIALAVSAGAPLSLALEREVFERSGVKLHNFYGASECGGIAYDDSPLPRRDAACVGRPLPGVSVSPGPDGRLLVVSDAVAEGHDSGRGDDLLGSGTYLTLDLGYADDAGWIYLTGSCGAAINIAGRKVSPAKVEAALLATGLVRRASVSGVASADAERCEEIHARIGLAPLVSLTEVKAALSRRLEAWEMPRHWEVREGE